MGILFFVLFLSSFLILEIFCHTYSWSERIVLDCKLEKWDYSFCNLIPNFTPRNATIEIEESLENFESKCLNSNGCKLKIHVVLSDGNLGVQTFEKVLRNLNRKVEDDKADSPCCNSTNILFHGVNGETYLSRTCLGTGSTTTHEMLAQDAEFAFLALTVRNIYKNGIAIGYNSCHSWVSVYVLSFILILLFLAVVSSCFCYKYGLCKAKKLYEDTSEDSGMTKSELMNLVRGRLNEGNQETRV